MGNYREFQSGAKSTMKHYLYAIFILTAPSPVVAYKLAIPPIDAAAPKKVETATFSTG
jgi:hypothetical protein